MIIIMKLRNCNYCFLFNHLFLREFRFSFRHSDVTSLTHFNDIFAAAILTHHFVRNCSQLVLLRRAYCRFICKQIPQYFDISLFHIPSLHSHSGNYFHFQNRVEWKEKKNTIISFLHIFSPFSKCIVKKYNVKIPCTKIFYKKKSH